MKSIIPFLLTALCLAAVALAQTTKPARPLKPERPVKPERPDRPERPEKPDTSDKADKPVRPTKADAAIPADVQTAVTALGKEMEAALKSPDAPLRTEADYFKSVPLTLDQAKLLDLLGKRLHSDARADAYVKWQLLGGLGATFDEKSAAKAVQIYGRLGAPPTRPGGTPADQTPLKQLVSRLDADNLDKANEQWRKKLADFDRLNGPALRYRDVLYNRLPKSGQVIRAGLQDAEERMQAGHPSRAFIKQVTSDAVTVAANLSPAAVNNLAGLLRPYAGRQIGEALDEIQLDDNKRGRWKTEKLEFERKMFEDADESLVRISRTR
ncbi:MAG TPA: hypothetical protein VF624_11355 [Tepidisphaeraceae bacterium]